MGGQDGSARDLLAYDTTSNTLMAGLEVEATEKLDLGLNVSWMRSDAGLDPFALPAEDYVATHPPTMYDFSRAHTYSDLESSRVGAEVKADYSIRETFWVGLRYHWAEYTDDAHYLEDFTGTMQLVTGYLGWKF